MRLGFDGVLPVAQLDDYGDEDQAYFIPCPVTTPLWSLSSAAQGISWRRHGSI